MKSVSTSTQLKRRKSNQDFMLKRMELIHKQADGIIDVPHRHDYYTVVFAAQVRGKHVIDYKSFSFEDRQVYFVSPGQVHQVVTAGKPEGWVITFTRDFMTENNIPERFISNLNLFRQFGDSPPLNLKADDFIQIKDILLQMEACLPLEMKYRNRALGAYLQLFLIYCNNSCSPDLSELDEEHSGICMLRDFKSLVDQNFKNWHKVNTYASEIHISPKHLSQTVKDITGKTAKEFIQDRIILEAKRMLLHTQLNVKEIAYFLGFDEPLHFSSFFKRQCNISPSAFREGKSL